MFSVPIVYFGRQFKVVFNSTENTMVHIVCNFYLTSTNATEAQNSSYETVAVVLIVVNALASVFVTLSNFTAMYTIVRTPSLHSPSNFFILGLVMSDFAVGTIAQPALITVQASALKNNDIYFCNAVKVFEFVGWTLASVSLLNLTALTADRFFAIHFHLRYQEFVTNRRVGIVLVIIWIYGLLSGWLKILFGKSILVLHVIALVPVALMNVKFLLKIHRTVRRHSAEIESQQQTAQTFNVPRMKKSVKVTYLVVGTFAAFYLPYICCAGAIAIRGKENPDVALAYRVTESLVLLNSFVNPIIYYWRIEDLRNATRQLMCIS